MHRRQFLYSAAAMAAGLPLAGKAGAQRKLADLNVLDQFGQMNSVLVQRGDETVLAQARRPGGLDRVANIKSCSKSIVALLLGIAIDRGEISSVDATLSEVAPNLIPADATDGVGEITMADLVTLRAGLASTSGGNYGAWVSSGNWVSEVLRQPMQDEPGGRMIYSTGTTHILGAALAEATGKSLMAQARERLGAPLGIDIPSWVADPQGYYFGGNEMGLTPNAMLKIAIMMRDGGEYEGQQIVPREWVLQSIVPRTVSPYSGMGYGYGWFITDSGYVLARGYGGQVIAAHPGENIAVAITSDPTKPARSGGYFGDIVNLLEGPFLAA